MGPSYEALQIPPWRVALRFGLPSREGEYTRVLAWF
jgi:hypothetical protein